MNLTCQICNQPAFEIRGTTVIVTHNANNHAAQIDLRQIFEAIFSDADAVNELREFLIKNKLECVLK